MSVLEREFAAILDGAMEPAQLTAFLQKSVALMHTPEAIAAGARALRERMAPIAAPEGAIDVCGTGGDGAHTLNISTAVAFVVAGCGVPVAKHGNRAMSSSSGAADVLEALGVRLTADKASLERCLSEARIAFLFAQHHHPAMRFVAQARREFGRRTIFNLLGPLSNPAGVRRQLVGVFAPDLCEPMAQALALLGSQRAWTVHGAGGLDELAPGTGNTIVALDHGAIEQRAIEFLGGADFNIAEVRGSDAKANAAALRALLTGESRNEAYRAMVELNAAAALCVAGLARDLGEGAVLARESLEEGEALAALERLIAITAAAP